MPDLPDLIRAAGFLGILLIVFAESGLLLGVFLPGDSLLFTAGFLASQGIFDLPSLAVGCALAAIAGDAVGYAFGRHIGRRLFERPDSRWFKRRHLLAAEAFYAKHGGKAIVLARFIPIVRTFAPIVAGVGHMRYPPVRRVQRDGRVALGSGSDHSGLSARQCCARHRSVFGTHCPDDRRCVGAAESDPPLLKVWAERRGVCLSCVRQAHSARILPSTNELASTTGQQADCDGLHAARPRHRRQSGTRWPASPLARESRPATLRTSIRLGSVRRRCVLKRPSSRLYGDVRLPIDRDHRSRPGGRTLPIWAVRTGRERRSRWWGQRRV